MKEPVDRNVRQPEEALESRESADYSDSLMEEKDMEAADEAVDKTKPDAEASELARDGEAKASTTPRSEGTRRTGETCDSKVSAREPEKCPEEDEFKFPMIQVMREDETEAAVNAEMRGETIGAVAMSVTPIINKG